MSNIAIFDCALTDEQKRGNRCADKQVYYTVGAARKAVKQQHRLYSQKMHFYQCKVCGFWHLSKRKRPRKEYVIRTMHLRFFV